MWTTRRVATVVGTVANGDLKPEKTTLNKSGSYSQQLHNSLKEV